MKQKRTGRREVTQGINILIDKSSGGKKKPKPSPKKRADDSDDETLESMKAHAFAKPSPEKCADDSS